MSGWKRRYRERREEFHGKLKRFVIDWRIERGFRHAMPPECQGEGPEARYKSGGLRANLYRVSVDVKQMMANPAEYFAYLDLMHIENVFRGKHTTFSYGIFEGIVYYGFVEMCDAMLLAWRFPDYCSEITR